MAKHIELAFEQALIDRVFDDIQYPAKLVDDHEKFDESTLSPLAEGELPQGKVTFATGVDLFSWASANADTASGEQILAFKAEILENLAVVRRAKSDAGTAGRPWEGPTDAELDEIELFGNWDIQFFLAWVRVIVKTRPQAKLASPTTQLDRIRVEVSATGELWVKHPWLKCVRRCDKPFDDLCCKWKKVTKWTRVASVTLRNIDIYADGRLEFKVDAQKNICAIPWFSKLRIDKDIFDKIPLEHLVNYFLRKEKTQMDIVKAEDLVLDFKSLSLLYLPQEVSLPSASNKLVAVVEFVKS